MDSSTMLFCAVLTFLLIDHCWVLSYTWLKNVNSNVQHNISHTDGKEKKLQKGPKASFSNSISQPVEVVQPEGRNSGLHTFTYPQLRTPYHPWDGVTTGVHLEAKRPFPKGPLWPHCAFVPQWDPLPLQSPANHLLQRQSHLCRPRVNFVWTSCGMHTVRTP